MTPEYLRECLDYEPEAGKLLWKTRPSSHFRDGKKKATHLASIWNSKYAGRPAFEHTGNHGYKASSLGGKRYLAHRVAWAIYHGDWPDGEIDHINGDRTDNRISNLRSAPRSENAKNLSVKSGSDRGVYWYQQTSRWVAKIHHERQSIHLGYFKEKSDAIAARRDAERRLGFHPNHGRTF